MECRVLHGICTSRHLSGLESAQRQAMSCERDLVHFSHELVVT